MLCMIAYKAYEVRGMARTKTKSGSKVIVTCPVCGNSYTKAGMIGHLRFKHGRDHKAPMIPIPRPQGIYVLTGQKAISPAPTVPPIKQLYRNLSELMRAAPTSEAALADIEPVIKAYCSDHKTTVDKVYMQLEAEKKRHEAEIQRISLLMAKAKGVCKVCGQEIYQNGYKAWFHYKTPAGPVHKAVPKIARQRQE